jgi:hypothetical protein
MSFDHVGTLKQIITSGDNIANKINYIELKILLISGRLSDHPESYSPN